jgi:hypothetical protein
VVTKRIVVVGGSSHAYHVLENLYATPHITLPNVYFVIDKLPLPLRKIKKRKVINDDDNGGNSVVAVNDTVNINVNNLNISNSNNNINNNNGNINNNNNDNEDEAYNLYNITNDQEESKFDDDYSGCFSLKDVNFPLEKELYAMGLLHKLNVVQGGLTDVDRESKAIVVADDVIVEYDLLVISTATQGFVCCFFFLFFCFFFFKQK